MNLQSRRYLSAGLALGLAVFSTGCLKWFSDDVAIGVARLTIRNTGAILSVVSADTTCGFENPDVLRNAAITGPVGGSGSATWVVKDCAINLGELHEIGRDCNNAVTYASGRLTVSARKTVSGRLTGNPASPVVPSGPDAVLIEITSATFKDFLVTRSDSENALTMKSGSISATIKPRLAASASKGACAVVTPNVAFADVTYLDAELHVRTPDREFDLPAPTSAIRAENGSHGIHENAIRGEITVWDHQHWLLNNGEGEGLDPEYDAAKFAASYACLEDITSPVSYTCDIQPLLAEGAARLIVRTLGIVGTLANADPNCGFESPTSGAAVELNGNIGYDGGSATFRMTGCTLDFAQATEVMTDCNGVTTYVEGTAVVTGTKTVHGYITGDPYQPVVPTSWEPADISLRANLSDFRVWTSASPKSLTIKSGWLTGDITPRTAIDTVTGACSVSTPVSEFDSVRLSNADVRLSSDGSHFDMHIGAADLHAVNGTKGSYTNFLAGTISVDGASVEVPLGEMQPILDPDFEPTLFRMGYDCTPNMIIPTSTDQCSFRTTLAQGAARLAVKTIGMITKNFDEDDNCGLGNIANMIPSEIAGSLYGDGTMKWYVEGCVLGGGSPVKIAEDCVGTSTYFKGTATVTVTKTVDGYLLIGYPPIKPQDREGAQFDFHDIVFNDFVVYDLPMGASEPEATLTLHSGSMSATVNPITGEADNDEGYFYIKTPLAAFHGVTLKNVDATLRVGAKQFHITLNGSDLEAFNGSFRYRTNEIDGTIQIDGNSFSVPVNLDDPTLDPEYDQAAFDATYVCREHLKETVPPAIYLGP